MAGWPRSLLWSVGTDGCPCTASLWRGWGSGLMGSGLMLGQRRRLERPRLRHGGAVVATVWKMWIGWCWQLKMQVVRARGRWCVLWSWDASLGVILSSCQGALGLFGAAKAAVAMESQCGKNTKARSLCGEKPATNVHHEGKPGRGHNLCCYHPRVGNGQRACHLSNTVQ